MMTNVPVVIGLVIFAFVLFCIGATGQTDADRKQVIGDCLISRGSPIEAGTKLYCESLTGVRWVK